MSGARDAAPIGERETPERRIDPRPAATDAAQVAPDIWYQLRRRWMVVAALAGLMALLASALASLTEPLPSATAELRLERNVAGEASPTDHLAVEERMRALASDDLLLRAIAKAGLDSDAVAARADGPLDTLIRMMPWTPRVGARDEVEAKRTRALASLPKRLQIQRSDDQAGIRITVKAASPEVAARTADAIADVAIEDPPKAAPPAAPPAMADVDTRQLDELKRRATEAQEALARFKTQHASGDDAGSDPRLSAFSGRLSAARTRTAELNGRVDQIDRARRGAGSAGKGADSFGSKVLATLQTRAGVLAERNAALQKDLGPRHPDIIAVTDDLRDIRRQIVDELERIARGTRTDLARAQASEADLAKSLKQLSTEIEASQKQSDRLPVLERDRDAAAAAYAALLARTQDVVQPPSPPAAPPAFTLLPATVSPIDPWPRQAIFVLSALAAGLGIGIAWAQATEQSEPTIRSVEQLEAVHDMPVIIVPRRGVRGPAVERLLRRVVTGRRARGKDDCVYGVLLAGAPQASARLAAALAQAAAALGDRVIRVEVSATAGTVGLAEVLRGEVPLESALVRSRDGSVTVLPAGRPSGSDWRQTRGAGWLFAQLAPRFDLMIVDGGSAQLQTRTAPLFADCAEVFLVVERGGALRRDASEPLDGVRALGATPTAIVMLD